MQSIKVKTTAGKTVEITIDELHGQFLQFCRVHFAAHSSEILLGDDAKKNPEFIITPCKAKKS